MTNLKPFPGHKRRGRVFHDYFQRQPPERRAEILSGENAFNSLRRDTGSLAAVTEIQYAEDLTAPVPIEGGQPIRVLLDGLCRSW